MHRAFQECSGLMRVQGVCDACMNGALEGGALSSRESNILDLLVFVNVLSVLFKRTPLVCE